jgi:hypothetical protein
MLRMLSGLAATCYRYDAAAVGSPQGESENGER